MNHYIITYIIGLVIFPFILRKFNSKYKIITRDEIYKDWIEMGIMLSVYTLIWPLTLFVIIILFIYSH